MQVAILRGGFLGLGQAPADLPGGDAHTLVGGFDGDGGALHLADGTGRGARAEGRSPEHQDGKKGEQFGHDRKEWGKT